MKDINTFYKQKRYIKSFLIIIFFGTLSLFTANILSYPSGKTGHTATNGQGCTCHTASSNSGVSLSLSGPSTVNPNSTNNYSLTVNQSLGKTLAGVNIAARQSQNGTVINNLSTSDSYLQLSGNELTHRSSPNNKTYSGTSVSFDFTFTAPSTPGTYYIQAISLAANGNGSADNGDVWNWLTPVAITVSAPSQTLVLTNPTGGQAWCQNQSNNITWTSTNVTNVKIELSTDGGSSFPVTLTASTPADAGSWSWSIPNTYLGANFKIKISDAANASLTSTSTNAFSINAATAITEQPTSQSVCQNQNVTFRVNATGGNLNYQWKKNGAIIPASNGNTLTLTQVVKADEGSYDCTVTGSCGNPVTSSAATLTVKAPPAITAHPQNLAICVGQSASFSVTATGENLTYLWLKNGAPISAPNSNTLNIPSAGVADSGSYSCNVSGTCSPAVTSNAGRLTVNASPTITKQPVSTLDACLGSKIELTVEAVGGELQYLWKRNGLPVEGQTSSKLVIQNAGSIDNGTYICQITSNCGNPSITNPTTVNVFKAISIKENPASSTNFEGESVTLKVVTADGGKVTYQWRKNDKNITGKTQSTLELANIAKADAGVYDCVVTAQCGGSVNSNGATITVKEKGTGPILSLSSNKVILDTTVVSSNAGPKEFKALIKNVGSQDLIISNATLSGSDANSFAISTVFPKSLKQNETLDLSIIFSPTKAGLHSASINFTSNATENPVLELSGFGALINVYSMSDNINFGLVEINKSTTKSLLIKNQSNIPAEINSIDFSGNDKDAFKLDNSVKFPIMIPIESNVEIPIIFSPIAIRDYSANANLTARYLSKPFSVTLNGGSVLGINDQNESNEYLVKPNPSNENIVVDLKQNYGMINFRIYDNSGRLRYSNEIYNSNQIKWDTKDLQNNMCESGVYRCAILADGTIQYISIIIQR